MKTVGSIVSRNRLAVRRKFAAPVISELAHDLFNQLTVINLCGGQLAAVLRAAGDPAITKNLETLARASEEATKLAERLAQLMAEQRLSAHAQAAKIQSSETQTNKILRIS